MTIAKWVRFRRALDPVFGCTRAKGFDTFCPFGPAVDTGLDPATLTVTTRLDGELRQAYPISETRFPVEQLIRMISRDPTLLPGDIVLCGTSLGVGSVKPGSRVKVGVEIGGIGTLGNRFEWARNRIPTSLQPS